MVLEMRLRRRVVPVFLCVLCVISVIRSSSSSSVLKNPFLGISPQDAKYYQSSSEIKCRDGSKKFTKAQLNDDFCDCADGTDEPGTSACPNGKFYCRNAGHTPQSLFSSRVNDGICDCCDGSDEYDGQVKCPNTCWEAGKAAREKLKKKIATYKEGLVIRKQEIEQAKVALVKDEAELAKLKNEEKILKGLVQQLKDRKEQIEKAEEKERLQKEKEEKERKEAELAAKDEKEEAEEKRDGYEENAESKPDDVIGNIEGSPSDQKLAAEVDDVDSSEGSAVEAVDQSVKEESLSSEKDSSEVESHSAHDIKGEADNVKKEGDGVSKDTEELSKEELGRLVASRWTGEKTDKPPAEAEGTKGHDKKEHEGMPRDSHDEEDDLYASETDDDTGDTERYDDNDVDEDAAQADEEEYRDESTSSYKSDIEDELDLSDTTTSSLSWLEKIQQTVKNILQAVNLFQTPVDKSEADHVRKEYDESSSKLSKMKSRISSLTKKLKYDFGPEKEFYSFYGKCFENKQNKYVYKVCPYKEASQVEGYSTTRLGQWDKFEDSYQFMIFSNGDKCWNGPDRSLKVKLRCGLKNEVADVDEPSRCEYVAILTTPARCLEDKLKELEQMLESMNQEQPQNHDEL